ncbi:SDR family NAD(P)-dependent oxidoreductase [Solirubrobacter sp. CPCC 204708]|uniref:Short-chain dehydrogenase/reductase n=1 Tax=Solirubrobacter deserti TaxID=2282478 RepID=A0ABT4RKR6_9ACTN|nr:short-chain dehydrogenase/reductase [Solirubrobacter deserti]MBE2319065.1 SDR family NAD(P)-dependent oxidoreductase [Solirubrobacter deserti]MDA0139144.1 short-chain dehydrogenase/reductase [Solirubrobacter deserti]
MVWNLSGRVALITGAASGIGAELARQLAARGMRPALIDVDRQALQAVSAGLPGAETAVADVRDGEALTAAIDDLAARCGGLDVAVANAGVATGGPLRLVGPETVEETLDINLLGVWRTTRAALPHVLERRGYVLLVSSAAAVFAPAGLGAYSMSKAGVEALGRVLRTELRTHGVGVGVAYYLFLNTPMVAGSDNSPIFAGSRSRLPGPLAKTWPLEPAVARTVRGIERRSRAVAYPPFLHALMAVRGLLDNALVDRVSAGTMPAMEAAFAAEAERVGAGAAARAVGGR